MKIFISIFLLGFIKICVGQHLIFIPKTSRVVYALSYIDNNTAVKIGKHVEMYQAKYLGLRGNYIKDNAADIISNSIINSQITSFSLENNHWESSKGIVTFVNVLKYTNVIYLNLASNLITDDTATSIAASLRGSKIKYLNLADNQLGPHGAEDIAKGLTFSQVTSLRLEYNFFGTNGAIAFARHLKDTKIVSVNLGFNYIESEGAGAIANALINNENLVHLSLGFNPIGNEGILKIANVLKYTLLYHVNLETTLMTEEGAMALADVLNETLIFVLNLSGNDISPGTRHRISSILKENQSKLKAISRQFEESGIDENSSDPLDLQFMKYAKSKLHPRNELVPVDSKPSYMMLGLMGPIVVCISLILFLLSVTIRRSKSLEKTGSLSKIPLVA